MALEWNHLKEILPELKEKYDRFIDHFCNGFVDGDAPHDFWTENTRLRHEYNACFIEACAAYQKDTADVNSIEKVISTFAQLDDMGHMPSPHTLFSGRASGAPEWFVEVMQGRAA